MATPSKRQKTMDYDWQLGTNTIQNRDMYILENQMWTDCSFLIGTEEILCHRLYLAKSSPVFAAMLYGGLSNNTLDKIFIPDTTAAAFKTLLGYVYSGEVKYENFNLACEVLALAKKYLMPTSCMKQCRSHIWAYLYHKKKNLAVAYEWARKIDEPELEETINQLLRSDGKKNIDRVTRLHEDVLMNLVQAPKIYFPECELFELCLAWAKNKAKVVTDPADGDEKKEADEKSVKKAMQPFISHLRFLAMPAKDFERIFENCKLISIEHVSMLHTCLTAPKLGELPSGFCAKTKSRVCNEVSEAPLLYVSGCVRDDEIMQPIHLIRTLYSKFATLFVGEPHWGKSAIKLHVRVPLQQKPTDAVKDSYDEEFTLTMIYLNAKTVKLLHKQFYTHSVKYDQNLEVFFDIPEDCFKYFEKKKKLIMSVIYHVSGVYPLKKLSIYDLTDNLVPRYDGRAELEHVRNIAHRLATPRSNVYDSDNDARYPYDPDVDNASDQSYDMDQYAGVAHAYDENYATDGSDIAAFSDDSQ